MQPSCTLCCPTRAHAPSYAVVHAEHQAGPAHEHGVRNVGPGCQQVRAREGIVLKCVERGGGAWVKKKTKKTNKQTKNNTRRIEVPLCGSIHVGGLNSSVLRYVSPSPPSLLSLWCSHPKHSRLTLQRRQLLSCDRSCRQALQQHVAEHTNAPCLAPPPCRAVRLLRMRGVTHVVPRGEVHFALYWAALQLVPFAQASLVPP